MVRYDRDRIRRALLLCVVTPGAIAGCSADHDLLAQKYVDSGVPSDATVADWLGEEGRVASPDAFDAAIFDAMDASEPLPPEPPGRWSLTWTQGLADVARARFCFVPATGTREMRDQAIPLPEAGLAFGKSLLFSEFRGIDLSTTDIHPYVIALDGEGAGTGPARIDAGEGCAAILDAADAGVTADGAARRPVVWALPIIPAGTLAEGQSYLGVVTGCARPWPYADVEAGADASDARDERARDSGDSSDAVPDVSDSGDAPDAMSDAPTMDVFHPPSRDDICGASTGAPNAGLVLVRMSRREVGAAFGFQAVHASAPVATARISLERQGGSAPIFSADVGPYQIAPRNGPVALTRVDFGPTIGSATLRASSPVGAFPGLAVSLGAALAASDIDEAGLAEGDLFSLVLIGPKPGQNAGPPWNSAQVAVIRNAPFAGDD